MSVSKYPYIEFSGALQQRTTIHLKRPNELVDASNVDFGAILGAMVRRPGAQGDALTLPKLPVDNNTLGAFIARFPAAAEIWAANNAVDDLSSVLQRWIGPGAGAWSVVRAGLLPDAEINMTFDADEVWVSSYAPFTDTVGDPFTVDPSHAVSTVRQLQFAPKARFFQEFNGAMWAANVTIAGVRYRDRLYKSSGLTGVIAFVRAPTILTQTAAAPTAFSTPLDVDSVRYVKATMPIEIYAAGTDDLLYSLVVTAVDNNLDNITFTPDSLTFADTDINTTTDVIIVPTNSWLTAGIPITFWKGSADPGGLVTGAVYYAIPAAGVANALHSPAAAADIPVSGAGFAWTNPGNATVSDNTYATATSSGLPGFTHYLESTGFGFAVPPSSSILGIKLEVEVKQTSSLPDAVVELVKAGTPVGSNYATGAALPSTDTYVVYGGPTDLWGTTWTPADVNDVNFGAIFQGFVVSGQTISVDHMRITVYYTDNTGLKLATSRENALAGTAIDITTQGTGPHRVTSTLVLGNKDEIWAAGRKGKLTRFWNTDYRNPEDSDYTKLPPSLDATNDITGVGALAGRMFIFTENSTIRFDGLYPLVLKRDVGCISARTICYYDSFMAWLDSKGQVWIRNEEAGTMDIISVPVQKTIRRFTQDQLKLASAVCVGYMMKLTLGTDPLSGKTLRLTYNFQSNMWAIEYFAPQMPVQLEYKYIGIVKPHFFDEHGQMWVDEQGDDDNGATIPFDAELGDDNFGVDEVKKFLGVQVYSDNIAATKVMISIDRGDWIEVGELTKPVQTIAFEKPGKPTPKGTLFNLRFVNSSTGNPVQIHKAVVSYNREEDTFRATPR